MLFKFTGQYTNGHTSITYDGVTFEGHEPAEVESPDLIRRLSGSSEFEEVKNKGGRPKAVKPEDQKDDAE